MEKPIVLLVEDDTITQEVIRFFLQDYYDLDVVESGIAAIDAVKTKKYFAILMDINLGKGKSGIDVTKEIRLMPEGKDIPIIAETAFAMRGDKQEFLAAGCNYYIAKPFTRDEILRVLDKINKDIALNS